MHTHTDTHRTHSAVRHTTTAPATVSSMLRAGGGAHAYLCQARIHRFRLRFVLVPARALRLSGRQHPLHLSYRALDFVVDGIVCLCATNEITIGLFDRRLWAPLPRVLPWGRHGPLRRGTASARASVTDKAARHCRLTPPAPPHAVTPHAYPVGWVGEVDHMCARLVR